MATTPSYIQIVIKNGVVDNWYNFNTDDYLLAQGEQGAVWRAQVAPDGTPLFEADGITPLAGMLLFEVIGDGMSRFSELVPIWPVRKASFNSIVSSRQGSARNLENLADINSTATYQTLDEVIEALIHPYARPQFNAFNPSGFASLEVGLPLNVNGINFSWDSANRQNVQPASVLVRETFNGANNTLVSGKNGQGSFQATGLNPRIGTSIGQTIVFTLLGQNTKGEALNPAYRQMIWEGKRVFFTHPNSEWLIDTFTASVGETPGSTGMSDATLAVLLNNKLNETDVLGGASFGTLSVDGTSAGARLYVLYPEAYRSSQQWQSTGIIGVLGGRSRRIQLTRNGVPVWYWLFGLDKVMVNIAEATAL